MSGYSQHKINGTALQELRWNILEVSGTDSVPGRRGKNLATPYADGDYSFGEKFYDNRSFRMKFVVLPQDAAGEVTAADGPRYHLRKNLDDLKAILQLNSGFQTYSFVVKDGVGGTVTREVDVEIMNTSEIKEYKKVAYTFNIEFEVARPFWRELPIVTHQELNKASFPYGFNLDTAGNAPIGDAVITITCDVGGTNPSLECTSTGDLITIADTLIAADEYILDLGAKSFTKNGSRADTFITRNKAWFMRLPASASLAMVLDADSGTYDLEVEYYKKWL